MLRALLVACVAVAAGGAAGGDATVSGVYLWRMRKIAKKDPSNYDDKYGPFVLVLALSLAAGPHKRGLPLSPSQLESVS